MQYHDYLDVLCTQNRTQEEDTKSIELGFKIRITDTVGFKFVNGRLPKVPVGEAVSPRTWLSERRSLSRRETFIYESQSGISMAPLGWNTPGVPKPYSSRPHLSETNFRSWRFHPTDHPYSQARHPDVRSALSHCTDHLMYPIDAFDKVWGRT